MHMNSTFEVKRDRFAFLQKNGIPESTVPTVVAGAAYFEHMGGVASNEYWTSEKFDNRDEFFVVLNSYFGLVSLIHKLPHNNEWRLKFDVAFLFQVKSTAQAAKAINLLTGSHCYADAFAVCRTMISRLNLLILCALNPNLHSEWLKNPGDKRFLDVHIREELIKNGIPTVPHLYKFTSEIIHGKAEGLLSIGYLEKGLFSEIPAINNQIWVMAKFIVGMTYYVMLTIVLQDCEGKTIPDEVRSHKELFSWFSKSYLVYNRWDQLWTFIAEDRHWGKVDGDKTSCGGAFDFEGMRMQIEKHCKKGAEKKLSKKYDA